MKRFAGQICLVTAATAGIGFAIAERMAKEGGKVHICSRKKENVDGAVQKFKELGYDVTGHVCDVVKKD